MTGGPTTPPHPGPRAVPALPRDTAQRWVRSYERMMTNEIAARGEQLAVVAATARQRLDGHRRPVLLELGCGPASLARQLAAELPAMQVIAVDADPLLLTLASALAHPRVRLVEDTVGSPGWVARLPAHGPVDLAIAVSVVHYLHVEQAAALYIQLARLLAPDGALLLADAFPEAAGSPSPGLLDTERGPAERAARSPATSDVSTWMGWWRAVGSDPQLRQVAGTTTGPACDADVALDTDEHLRALRDAGFGRVTHRWRGRDHAVLLAELA